MTFVLWIWGGKPNATASIKGRDSMEQTLTSQISSTTKTKKRINHEAYRRVETVLKNFSVLNYKPFRKLLFQQAKDNAIFLSAVDFSFTDMAMNFYETSLKKFGIHNYVFVCSNPEATSYLRARGVTAITMWNDTHFLDSSSYHSEGFGMKNIHKTIAIFLALQLNFTVTVVDVDIVFLQNPEEFLHCNTCDMIFQVDRSKFYNGGFYVSYPKENVIKTHSTLLQSYDCWKYTQQRCLNKLVRKNNVNVFALNVHAFPSGHTYFDIPKRMFAGDKPCPLCVIVHNNWISSQSAKIYRFKEHLLWEVDECGYYSNVSAKYLLYENHAYVGDNETQQMEEAALKNAFVLAHLLNRIVILPRFFCYWCKAYCPVSFKFPLCPTNTHFNITALDRIFRGKYREHVFLRHKKVPTEVKMSVTKPIFLNTSSMNMMGYDHTFEALNPKYTAFTFPEFSTKMHKYSDYSVIKFHSLYGSIFSDKVHPSLLKRISIGVTSLHI